MYIDVTEFDNQKALEFNCWLEFIAPMLGYEAHVERRGPRVLWHLERAYKILG